MSESGEANERASTSSICSYDFVDFSNFNSDLRKFLLRTVFHSHFLGALSSEFDDTNVVNSLLKLAHGAGVLTRLITRVLGVELDKTKHVECLFRSDSLCTLVVSDLMRKYSKRFLEHLGQTVLELIPPKDLEVDPAKQPDEALRQKNMEDLCEVVNKFLKRLCTMFYDPVVFEDTKEMRALLMTCAHSTETRHPGGHTFAIINTLFLRCVCPFLSMEAGRVASSSVPTPVESPATPPPTRKKGNTMLNFLLKRSSGGSDPQALKTTLQAPSQRTLILVSKTLQTLVNDTDLKEEFMLPLNDCIKDYRQQMAHMIEFIYGCDEDVSFVLQKNTEMTFYNLMKHMKDVFSAVQPIAFKIKKSLSDARESPELIASFKNIVSILSITCQESIIESEDAFAEFMHCNKMQNFLSMQRRRSLSSSGSADQSAPRQPSSSDSPSVDSSLRSRSKTMGTRGNKQTTKKGSKMPKSPVATEDIIRSKSPMMSEFRRARANKGGGSTTGTPALSSGDDSPTTPKSRASGTTTPKGGAAGGPGLAAKDGETLVELRKKTRSQPLLRRGVQVL